MQIPDWLWWRIWKREVAALMPHHTFDEAREIAHKRMAGAFVKVSDALSDEHTKDKEEERRGDWTR
jgi:hypothetical protein